MTVSAAFFTSYIFKRYPVANRNCYGNIYVTAEQDVLQQFRSWTGFMKSISTVKTHEVILEYWEYVPLPSRDDVCQWYMDNLLKEAE